MMKFHSALFAFLLFLGSVAQATLDFGTWGQLAVQDGGRRKPMETFARESLLKVHGKSTVQAAGRTYSANEFILSMLLSTRSWEKEPIILLSYKPLARELKLDDSRKRFSFEELSTLTAIAEMAKKASELDAAKKEVSRTLKEAQTLAGRLTLFANLVQGNLFQIVPHPSDPSARWLSPTEIASAYPEAQAAIPIGHLRELANAYLANDQFKFSLNANQLRQELRKLSPAIYPSDTSLRIEYFYNHLDPFDWAAVCFGVATVLLAVANSFPLAPARWLGIGSGLLGLLLMVVGIVLRSIIAGRPPVTNMYESVIWVAFGTVLFGFAFFWRYRSLIYLLAALPVSLLFMLLLAQLPVAMPSSIDPLVPVLRSNFWLTIHVLTITISYAAFALAMGFGHIVLYRYIRNPAAAAADGTLHLWLYRIMQLGVLLLAAGTILGGVWANYSWGRFWGWDPKETWALIALLCYIFVLHGRLVGWWNYFGLAVASVICFCAVLMTWYGVNFVLGKGLHSYGFGLGGESYVAAFVALDLAFVAWACVRHLRNNLVARSL